jgi:GNAT superfamily N-acetyltransferase
MPIRFALAADIPRLHAIRTSVRENRLSSPDRIDREMYRVRLEDTGRGWLFEEGGAVLGFAIADAATRSVWALFVSPDAEGRGIGRALLNEMTAWLFAQGPEPVWLTTAPGTRAERFYREAGWRETGRDANGEVRFEKSSLP